MPVKILVADDDQAMLGLYRRVFSQTDYSVTQADSYARAANLLKDGGYDLLITDYLFPDGVGTELIRMFRETCGGRSMLVTGTSGYSEQADAAGADCLIRKPFRVEQFLEAVGKALA